MKNYKNENMTTQVQSAQKQAIEPEVKVNRTYKDTLFRMIFKDKKELLSLYNALNNTDYTEPELLEIVTLENAVYMNMKNDLPEYFTQKLSDAYMKKTDHPDLDLTVHVYNINYGQNAELMRKCKTLQDYSIYVTRVREYAKTLPIDEAVDRAVKECISEGTLEAFLRKYRAEAKQMSIFEYNEEETMRLIRQDEREIGRQEGIVQGIQEGELAKLQEQIQKKLDKGCSVEEIADALEESPENIRKIIDGITGEAGLI